MGKNKNLRRAFSQLDTIKKDKDYLIPAILGFMINGVQTVEITSRPGYVYARVRSNTNEVVQVFNDKVSPVYDLPVLLIRDPNNPTRYKVDGRDTGRYENWGTASAFLPRHGDQHSFSTESGGGGDIVWVYSQQVVPWLVSPSGTFGSAGVVVHGHPHYDGGWLYYGGTGTSSIVTYKPTGSNSRMVLVYLDDVGNPSLLAGSYFNATITGTQSVLPYIPATPTATSIPLGAVRLVSGTSSILWDNIYDIRPFFGGGGGSIAGINVNGDGSAVVADATTLNFINVSPSDAGGGTADITIPNEFSHIRVWDESAGKFLYFAKSDAGLTSAIATLANGDVLYLPPGTFTGNRTIPSNTSIIGPIQHGIQSSFDNLCQINSSSGTVLTLGNSVTIKDISVVNNGYATGTLVGIDCQSNTDYLERVYIYCRNNTVANAFAIKSGTNSVLLGCHLVAVGPSSSKVPYDVIPRGYFVDNSDPLIAKKIQATNSLRIPYSTGSFSDPPTSTQLTTVFGDPTILKSGFVGFAKVGSTGTSYLVATDGSYWFQTSLTRAT